MPLDQLTKKRRVTQLKVPPLRKSELIASALHQPEIIRISRPRLQVAAIKIVGISPYVQHAFSEKQRKVMEETQRAGTQARSRRKRAPKDFEGMYEAAKHYSREGWLGMPAPGFRNAMIDACRLVGFKMTHAKMSVFVEADGYDRNDGMPLVRIHGEPHIHEASVRLPSSGSTDVTWRPMWDEGWTATVRVRWDEDQFSATDIHHLMLRAGLQVGVGEGRPNSKNSNGLGWGMFEIVP